MEKPKKPSRKKAAKRPTATTPAGKRKSLTVQKAQFDRWVEKEKQKTVERMKAKLGDDWKEKLIQQYKDKYGDKWKEKAMADYNAYKQ